jgi:sentrin-specific protease 1
LTRYDLRVLWPGVWLKDEAINFYLSMLRERQVALLSLAGAPSMASPEAADLQPGSLLRPVWVANTFFYSKLTEDAQEGATVTERGYCYAGVARWTKRERVNVFACRLLLVPLNFGNSHWALGVIDMATKRIELWDSLNGGGNGRVARTLLRLFVHGARLTPHLPR